MTQPGDASDLWAWAHDDAAIADDAEAHAAHVAAIVVTHNGARWLARMLDSLAAQTLSPTAIVVVDAGSTDGTRAELDAELRAGRVSAVVDGLAGQSFGANVALGLAAAPATEWLWLLHDDVVAAPDALLQLVRGALAHDADAVGPLLIEPRRRRGRTVRIAEAGQTITADGVVTGVIAEGTLDQGQLDGGPVLAVNACGMLTRRALFTELGGLDADLPSSIQGLEFGWRARVAGHAVITWPKARIEHVEASTRGLRDDTEVDPFLLRRRWGLTLNEAYRPSPMTALQAGRLRSASERRVIGAVVGKDFLDARLERRAVREWRKDRDSVERLHQRFVSINSGDPLDVESLRLTRANVRARRMDEWFGRGVDWLAEFGDRGGGPGLQELTGDDFARDEHAKRRLSPTWIVAWVLIIAAAVAARSLFTAGALTGAQLLPVPESFPALYGRFADPVEGVWPSSGAPWVGLVWLASLLTFGHPDIVVSLIIVGAVPAGFLLARRVLGRVVADRRVAVVGAACYGLIPVLTGAMASGQLGTIVWTLTLPILGHLVVVWWEEYDATWQVIGGVALCGIVLAAVEPLTWILVLVTAAGLTIRAGEGWGRASVAVFGPIVLLLTPFTVELVRFPGRLLTGIEPLLAPQAAPSVVDVLLGRSAPQAPPLWLSAIVVGALWVLAVIGARYQRMAVWGVVAAVGCAAVALGLTRLVVTVPPTGQVVRPQGSVWLVGLVAALVWGATLGLDSVRSSVLERGFGVRHLVVYVSGLLAVAALLAGTGWWVWAGTAGLERTTDTSIPAFIRKDAARGTARILALNFAGGQGGWALLSGDLTRLGDGERGLFEGGDRQANELAQSVATRLASGAEDESMLPDLQRLGVGYLWVTGASGEQLTAISNVPGLGVGATSEGGASWTIPQSGRLVVRSATGDALVDPDEPIPAGAAGRVLLLSEPLTAAPVVTFGGTIAERLPDTDGRLAYAVPADGGMVQVAPASSIPWWPIAPALSLLAVLLLAAPASNAGEDAHARAPRRADRRQE